LELRPLLAPLHKPPFLRFVFEPGSVWPVKVKAQADLASQQLGHSQAHGFVEGSVRPAERKAARDVFD
jgi:hypothetical protein